MSGYPSTSGLAFISNVESGGNPIAQNPSSTASGLYGFVNGTWQTYAPQAGVDINQYPTAASAPAEVQTSVAQITPISNWSCPGCTSGLNEAIASDPSLVSASPISSSQPAMGFSIVGNDSGNLGLDTGVPSTENPFYIPGTGTAIIGDEEAQNTDIPEPSPGNITGGLSGLLGTPSTGSTETAAGSTTGGSGFFNTLFTDIENWLERGAVIILGLIFVGVAAWALANGKIKNPLSRS